MPNQDAPRLLVRARSSSEDPRDMVVSINWWDLSLGLQIAQSRANFHTLGPKVGIIYIFGDPGLCFGALSMMRALLYLGSILGPLIVGKSHIPAWSMWRPFQASTSSMYV